MNCVNQLMITHFYIYCCAFEKKKLQGVIKKGILIVFDVVCLKTIDEKENMYHYPISIKRRLDCTVSGKFKVVKDCYIVLLLSLVSPLCLDF